MVESIGSYLGTSFPLFHVLFAAEDASEIMNVPAGRPIRPQCSAVQAATGWRPALQNNVNILPASTSSPSPALPSVAVTTA